MRSFAPRRVVRSFVSVLVLITAGPRLPAQPKAAPEEEPILLNPFSVSSKGDAGYLAQSSLSGSRLNTNFTDLAVPTTAFTQEFLQDTAVRSVDELALYMSSTEINYPEANQAFFTGDSVQLKIRGLSALTYAVNYFPTTLRLDLYNSGRVDQSRGANSILFGLGSPGGLVNVSTNRAYLNQTAGSVTVRVDSNDGLRTSLDYNRALIKDRLALRLDAVRDHSGTWRYHEYDHQDRVYLAARWKVSSSTQVDAEWEHGVVNKSIGSPTTAADSYTRWAAAGSRLSATANAAQSIAVLSTTNYIVIDATTGVATDWRNKTTTVANNLDGNAVYLTDFRLVPQRAALAAGPAFPQTTNYQRGSVFITHAFSRDFNLELAADAHNAPRDTINGASFVRLSADPNPTLPNGQPNPNAGRPYIEGTPVRNIYTDRSEALRLTVSYEHDFGRIIGRHQIAVLGENSWSKAGNLQMGPTNLTNPYNLASPEVGANRVNYRTYLDLNGPTKNLVSGNWMAFPLDSITESTTGRKIPLTWNNQAPGSALNRFQLETTMAVLQSHWLGGRLVTVAGRRENWQHSWYSPTATRGPAFGNFVLGPYIIVPGTVDTGVDAHNTTFSALFHLTRWLALTYNRASDFDLPSTTGSTPYGRVPAPTGLSQDYGVKINLGSRLSVTAMYFETSAKKAFNAASTLPSNPDSRINTIWTALAAAKVTPPGGGSALDAQILANGYTYDAVTKGWELEVIANPTDRWRLYLSGSINKSTLTNLGAESFAYFAQNRTFWLQGNNGRVLLDGSGGLAPVADNGTAVIDTVAKAVRATEESYRSAYTLGEGQRPRGQSPLKFSARTNYALPGALLAGADIGGGVRYQAGQVTDFVQPTVTAPAEIIYGRSNLLVDLNAGYQFRPKWSGREVRWKIQLNVNNLLDETSIIPQRATATGQTVAFRLQPPRQFILSNRVSF